MTLAAAKRHLKAYVAKGFLDPLIRDEALEKIVASWSSKAKGGKASRAKGHGYERDVANYLKPIYPNAKRGLQGRDGAEACDVEGTPLFIECKRHRKITGPLALYRKACEDAASDPEQRPAVMVLKEDGGPEVALVPLELLVGLLAFPTPNSMRERAEYGREIMRHGAETLRKTTEIEGVES